MMISLHSFREISIELLQFGYNLSPNHYKMAFYISESVFSAPPRFLFPAAALYEIVHFSHYFSHSQTGLAFFRGMLYDIDMKYSRLILYKMERGKRYGILSFLEAP